MAQKATKSLLATILCLMIVHSAWGQIDAKRLLRYTVDDGLSQNMVQAICEDRQGFMWFGTKDGLNRFDGYGFKVFRSEAGNQLSLSDNNITAIYEDKAQNLWIGTNNGGLNFFDRASGNFYVLPEIMLPDSIPGNKNINAITSDTNGDIWVTTRFSIFRIRIKNKNGKLLPNAGGIKGLYSTSTYFKTIRNGNKMMPNLGLIAGSDGYLYNMSGNNLFRSEKKSSKTSEPSFIKIYEVPGFAGMTEDTKGNIWFSSHQKGILCYNYSSRSFSKSFNDPRFKNPIYHNIANSEDGTIWFSEFGRRTDSFQNQYFLNYFNTNTRTFGALEPMEDVTANVIYFSSRDIMWIGTPGSGLLKYNLRSRRFHTQAATYKDVLEKNHLELVNMFYPNWSYLLVRKKGDSKLKIYNWVTETFYPASEAHLLLGKNNLPAFKPFHLEWLEAFVRKNGDMWSINRKECLLEKIDTNGKKVKTIKIGHPLRIFAYEDVHRNFWVGNRKGWLYKLNKNEDALDSFSFFKIPLDVQSYLTDEKGTIWMGLPKGLLKYDPESKKSSNIDIPGQRSSFSVLCLMNDPMSPHQYLWAGTEGGGLLKINKNDLSVTQYHLKDGLPNEVVYGILADRNKKIWVSTNEGISRFDPAKNSFTNFKKEDGLQSNEFNRFSYFQSADGTMMFGGIKGVNYFNPEAISEDTVPASIAFTGFKLFNKEIIPGKDGTPLETSIELTKNISLPWDQNTISFDFVAFDFNDPGRIMYSWKLEGLDKEWVTAGKEHSATYANLSPGKYTFIVKASNSAGYWPKEGKSITIIILPPWWRTWWAYTLYFIIAGVSIYSFFRFRLNRLRLQDALKQEKMEAMRLQELDEIKTRFFSNITHEFRTPLTLILGPAEQLIKKTEDKETKSELSRIERNARQLLKLINQLLDLNKLEEHSMKMERYSVEVIALIKDIVDSFITEANQKSINLSLHTDIESLNISSDTDKLQKIISNLLSNALKFTPANGKIDVYVESIRKENKNFLSIRVKDSGIGISADQQKKIFQRFYQADSSQTRRGEGTGIGLALVKELVELFEGHLFLKSELGKVLNSL